MGHEVAVNTLQLAVAFSAIANNGYLVRPYIVKRIYNGNNNFEQKTLSKVKRQIASENIMLKIKDMLRQVVLDGTGTEAKHIGMASGWKNRNRTKIYRW